MDGEDRDILVKIAGDVGYLRSSVETLVDANLPNRMSFIEGQQKVNNQRLRKIESRWSRTLRTAAAMTGVLAAIVGTTAELTGLFH